MKLLIFSLFFLIQGCSTLSFNQKIMKEEDLNITKKEEFIKLEEALPKNNIEKSILFFKNLEKKKEEVKSSSKFIKYSELNNFFNGVFEYKRDKNLYGMNDYWASLYEMMQGGFKGDCEDYTFAKIQLAESFGILKEDIFIGFTEKGRHIFPIFFDGTQYVVSDTNGKLRTFMSYVDKYPDMRVYSYNDIWITKDSLFLKKRGDKVLEKITGRAAESN